MDAILKDTATATYNEATNKQTVRQVKVGNSNFKVISIFLGKKTSSELVYNAAVKKILYEKRD